MQGASGYKIYIIDIVSPLSHPNITPNKHRQFLCVVNTAGSKTGAHVFLISQGMERSRRVSVRKCSGVTPEFQCEDSEKCTFGQQPSAVFDAAGTLQRHQAHTAIEVLQRHLQRHQHPGSDFCNLGKTIYSMTQSNMNQRSQIRIIFGNFTGHFFITNKPLATNQPSTANSNMLVATVDFCHPHLCCC